MEYAARSDFGLVAHQPNPSNQHCIPTKIYEYLGLGVPMLLQDHPWWKSVVDPYQAALILDFNHLQTDHLWRQMKNRRFYPVQPGPEILWQTEARKLTRLL
jgi:hypothetical protein